MVNSEGDWKKQEEAIDDWLKKRKALKDWLDGLADVYSKVDKAGAKVFTTTPVFDCHFVDSPFSSAKLLHDVRAYLSGKDSPLARGYTQKIEDFNQDNENAINWAKKMKPKK